MCWRVNRRENGGRSRSNVLTADKRGVFRLFCLPAPACLVVSSRECSRPRVQQQTINGALPLRMTPPWPFSTSPHCASTEPCGDTHSLGRTRRFEIASPRLFFFPRCWSTRTAQVKGVPFVFRGSGGALWTSSGLMVYSPSQTENQSSLIETP